MVMVVFAILAANVHTCFPLSAFQFIDCLRVDPSAQPLFIKPGLLDTVKMTLSRCVLRSSTILMRSTSQSGLITSTPVSLQTLSIQLPWETVDEGYVAGNYSFDAVGFLRSSMLACRIQNMGVDSFQ